jgi:hypothetical protein
MSDIVQQKTGVRPNRKCHQCKITAKESYELGPADTGIDHPEYSKTYSFYLHMDGKSYCPRCHREIKLKQLMDLELLVEKKEYT